MLAGFVLLAIACAFSPNARAAEDEVELLSGAKFKGHLIKETSEGITFSSDGMEMKLDTAKISSITSGGTGAFTSHALIG